MAKTFAATYLYSKYSEYDKKIFSAIMNGNEIDKDSDKFDDIKYEVKRRQVSNSLVKVLESKEVILLLCDSPLPKSFKVVCAKDIKSNKKDMKIFIDCSGIIELDDKTGKYKCRNTSCTDIFISYLVSAMHTFIYYKDEARITNDSHIRTAGASAFAQLFTHIVDRACKINSMPSSKGKCMYLASLYYLSNIIGLDHTEDRCKKIAKKISGLSDREAGIVDIQLKPESMMNINFFIDSVSDILRLMKLSLDVVVEGWMSVYGTGTIFALEMFPSFATMLTDAYVGAYINNQKTIEKVAGSNMTEFTKALLSIGAESV